jgi:hypothetical protein
MIFSAPIFLYLLPLAGLPVVFHLFLRQKKRQILFPTLMFFYRTDPRLNSRRKIHQLLLLIMRVLLIAFILLALSRPRFQSALPMGGKVSVVAVVDNSGSMSDPCFRRGELVPAQAGSDDKTKLDLAVEGAKRLVSSLGDSAQMNVVTLVQDPAAAFGDVLTSDRESLLASLDKIGPTNATGNAPHALAKALRLLQADSGRGGVVHVFTDLQEAEWADDALQSESADASIHVYLHRIESAARQQPNVAISSVQLPRQKILPRHPMKIGVACRNNSQAPATIRVNSIDDQDNKNTQQVVLEPGRTQVVEVGVSPDISGYHWLRTWIEGDGFSADNEAGIGILCQRTATVLFCGSPGEFGVLPTALSPDGDGQVTGMISQFGSIGQIPQADAEKPILIVAAWEDIRQLDQASSALQQYVESGGNLLIVPSLKRRSAAGKPPAWLGADTKARTSDPRGAKLEALETQNEFWSRIREATGTASLQDASVFAFYPLQLSEGFTPLLGTDFERVILAHRELGKGNIYVSGTAFDPRWNTLPLSGLLVVMAQSIAVAGASVEQDAMLSLVAGEYPQGIDAGGKQVEVVSLMGDAAEWHGLPARENTARMAVPHPGQVSEMPAFPRPGVCLVKADDREYCVSVRSSEKEGLTQFLGGSQVPAMEKITHTVVDYDPTEELRKYQYGHSRTFELFLPLVLLATAALLAEGWLANPIRARSQTRPEPDKRGAAPKGVSDAPNQADRQVVVGRGAG